MKELKPERVGGAEVACKSEDTTTPRLSRRVLCALEGHSGFPPLPRSTDTNPAYSRAFNPWLAAKQVTPISCIPDMDRVTTPVHLIQKSSASDNKQIC